MPQGKGFWQGCRGHCVGSGLNASISTSCSGNPSDSPSEHELELDVESELKSEYNEDFAMVDSWSVDGSSSTSRSKSSFASRADPIVVGDACSCGCSWGRPSCPLSAVVGCVVGDATHVHFLQLPFAWFSAIVRFSETF
jgi:hypothetical protein